MESEEPLLKEVREGGWKVARSAVPRCAGVVQENVVTNLLWTATDLIISPKKEGVEELDGA